MYNEKEWLQRIAGVKPKQNLNESILGFAELKAVRENSSEDETEEWSGLNTSMAQPISEKEYADDADGDWDSFDDSKMDELEKPEKIYNDEEDSAEQGNFDRALELFGAQIQKVVMDMIDDGYEPEDAVQFLRDLADQMEGGDLFEKKEKMEEKVKPSGEFDWKM